MELGAQVFLDGDDDETISSHLISLPLDDRELL